MSDISVSLEDQTQYGLHVCIHSTPMKPNLFQEKKQQHISISYLKFFLMDNNNIPILHCQY